MTDKYKILQLERVGDDTHATCELPDKTTFKAVVGMSKQAEDALWNYCHGTWDKDVMATVEHEEKQSNGVPVNGKLTTVDLV